LNDELIPGQARNGRTRLATMIQPVIGRPSILVGASPYRYFWSTGDKLEAGLLTPFLLVPLAFQAISFGILSDKLMNNNGSVWDFNSFRWKWVLAC